VVIHGGTVDRTRWAALVPWLEDQFTVYALDRRGRGTSGDTAPYAVQREVEDIQAVLEAVGQPVNLFGHSSGGILALHVALWGAKLSRLVLYEPPVRLPAGRLPPDLLPRLNALIAAGDRAGVVRTFLREGPRRPEPDQGSPEWTRMIALAHTIPYDVQLADECGFTAEQLQHLRVPTLLLVGSTSPHEMRTWTAWLASVMPDTRIVELPGQAHIAHVAAPDLLARELIRFLR
jgi:pimeloyl-ACP methyl ester carboxylesterase